MSFNLKIGVLGGIGPEATAEFYSKLIQKLQEKNLIKTKNIDLRKELELHVEKKKIKSVFILGTPNTIKQGLYKFKEIKTFHPNKKETKDLTRIIFNFNKGYKKEKKIKKTRS